MRITFARLGLTLAALCCASASGGDDPATQATDWKPLGLAAWKAPTTGWEEVADVAVNPRNERGLTPKPGSGVLYNGPGGRAVNLISSEAFGDVAVHAEFNVPKGSNSGVKLEGVYELQIFDSYGVKVADATHSGGVYPRAELLPRYRHIDDGYPPRVNASAPPGTWQTLDITFRAPRFDAAGKKTRPARFESVVLNGKVVQEGLDVPTPTGHVWRNPETPTGPLLLQGDHGAVAFRNVRVRPLK